MLSNHPREDVAWRISESGISVEKGRHSSGGGAFGSQASPAYTAAAVGVPGMTQVKLPNGAFGSLDPKKMPKGLRKTPDLGGGNSNIFYVHL